MAKILISSCLLGFKVRYNGNDMPVSDINFEKLCSENQIIPFCPEVSAGLAIPRLPAEIQGGEGTDVLSADARVLCNNGFDVTDAFLAGAKKALEMCIKESISFAVLTDSSPSCGSKLIYDGSFSGIKKTGKGVTAALLGNYGIKVFTQHEISEIFGFLNKS